MLQEKLKELGTDKKCPIAVVVRDGKILTGHRHYTKEKWKDISVWTIPGGRCDEGETLEQALRREVQEEVSITNFEIVDFVGEVPGAKEGDIVPIFYCTTNEDFRLMEPEKFSEWIWLPLAEYIAGSNYSGFNPSARKIITEYLKNKILSKKIIGIDFDDVIFNLSDHLLVYFNERFHTTFKRSDITMYQMGTLWGLSREEEKGVIMDFCLSELHHGVLPVKGAIEGIRELSKCHTLVVVTAREDDRQEITYKWLNKNLPHVFKSVVFTNHNHKDITKQKKKSEICLELGIEIFIDDSFKNILDISTAVKQVFLLDTPWNQGELPENVQRVFSWEEIVKNINKF